VNYLTDPAVRHRCCQLKNIKIRKRSPISSCRSYQKGYTDTGVTRRLQAAVTVTTACAWCVRHPTTLHSSRSRWQWT